MSMLVALAICIALGGLDRPEELSIAAELGAAEAAYQEGRYQDVLPALARVRRRHLLSSAEVLRAHRLEAFTHAAFDDEGAAVEAFRRVLGVDPAFQLEPGASPKLHRLLDRARHRGAIPPPETGLLPRVAEGALPTSPPPAPRPTGLLSRWWFWTAVGVVAVGSAATFVAVQSHGVPPAGNLGRGELR